MGYSWLWEVLNMKDFVYENEADKQYRDIVKKIINNGYSDEGCKVRTKWKDGTPAFTRSIISEQLVFTNGEAPILTTKKVAWQTAIKELLWIWQQKSNVVQDLRDMGVKIWDEWEMADGTIGKAYGYQLKKKNRRVPSEKVNLDLLKRTDYIIVDHSHIYLDQVDYLLHELKNNPYSRRHITTLWNPDDLDGMSLTPCVYETQWHVKEGELHLEVRCRSNDMALGNPFNIFQYNVLQRMFAQVLGYKLGVYTYTIGDCHVYDRHIDKLKEQIERPFHKVPELWINPDVKNFYDFTIDDFKLKNYEYGEKIDFEVAI